MRVCIDWNGVETGYVKLSYNYYKLNKLLCAIYQPLHRSAARDQGKFCGSVGSIYYYIIVKIITSVSQSAMKCIYEMRNR